MYMHSFYIKTVKHDNVDFIILYTQHETKCIIMFKKEHYNLSSLDYL